MNTKRIAFLVVAGIAAFLQGTGAWASEEWAKNYVIMTQKFEQLVPGMTNQLQLVSKCVFYPIYPTGLYPDLSIGTVQESIAERRVEALNALRSYHVYNRDGRLLQPKHGPFEVMGDELSRFYAVTDVPMGGCGDYLVLGDGKVVTGEQFGDRNLSIQVLEREEKQLFISALSSPPHWIGEKERRDLAKHDLSTSFDKSQKSDVGTFYDGRSWYLVRSYWLHSGFTPGAPSSLNVLMLYAIRHSGNKLLPSLVSVATASGEGTSSTSYFGPLDTDNDGANELIVEVFVLEQNYFVNVRRGTDGWHF